MHASSRTHRSARLAIGVATLLLIFGAGTALGFDEEGDGSPSEKLIDSLVEQLEAAGVETTAEDLVALLPGHGVGGAVRILTWADAAEMDPAEVAAMFDGGMGWGQIAKQLMEDNPDLDLSPGIGWVRGGHGHGHAQSAGEELDAEATGQGHGQARGHAHAPGQQD